MQLLLDVGHPIDALALLAGGLVTASRDGKVRRWSMDGSGGEVLLDVAPEVPSHLAVADGVLWVAAGASLWRIDDAGAVEVSTGLNEFVGGVAVTPMGVVFVGDDCDVRLAEPDGTVRWRGQTYKWGNAVEAQPGGTRAVVPTWDGYLYALDTADLPVEDEGSGEARYASLDYPTHPADLMPVMAAVWHGDTIWAVGHLLSGEGGGARCWRPGSRTWTGHGFDDPDGLNAVARSRDGRCVAVGSEGGVVSLLHPDSAAVQATYDLTEVQPGVPPSYLPVPHPVEFTQAPLLACVLDLLFTPDGAAVLAATAGGAVVRLPRR